MAISFATRDAIGTADKPVAPTNGFTFFFTKPFYDCIFEKILPGGVYGCTDDQRNGRCEADIQIYKKLRRNGNRGYAPLRQQER